MRGGRGGPGYGVKGGAASAGAGQHSAIASAPRRTPHAARAAAAPADADAVNNALAAHRPSVLNKTMFARHCSIISATMWILILACTTLAVEAGDVSNGIAVFSKCCPVGESLMQITDADFFTQYSCANRDLIETNYSVVVHPLVLGENVVAEYGIPEDCDELVLTEVNYELSSRNNHCHDRLALQIENDTLKRNIPQVVSLTCVTQPSNNTADYQINSVRKCCPSGQAFDIEYHECRNISENNERWLNYIDPTGGEFIYEVDYGLNCKLDEFAVELTEENFALSVEGSNLRASRVGETGEHLVMRGEWCADLAHGGRGLVARICTQDCAAFGAFCLKKCCPVGFHYEPRQCGSVVSTCVPHTDDPTLFNLSYYLDPLKTDPDFDYDATGIQTSLRCPLGKFVLNRTAAKDWHRLAANGMMVIPPSLGPPTHDFCLEAFDYRRCGGAVSPDVLLCFTNVKNTKNFFISFVAMSVSCVFLFLTLVVYCALPELRNLHGLTLICHVAMLLLAYCCLARVKYGYVADKAVCRLLGYMVYFGFVAAFSWLNVMCFDIWRTFGSVTVQPMNKAGAERKRFAWYSLYAWSVSVGMTGIMLLLDLYPITSVLTAHIGRDFCWFGTVQNTETDWSHYIFFVIPMGVVTCVNFVLWVLTARHCNRVKSEVHRLQAGSVGDRAKRRFRADRARYVLTGKLWVVMGAGWVWELLSTLVSEPKWLWDIIDSINELQGVWIFLILVLKPKLYFLIRKRLGLEKPDAQKNGTSSGRTSSTFLSRTISSDERANQRVSLTATKEKQ